MIFNTEENIMNSISPEGRQEIYAIEHSLLTGENFPLKLALKKLEGHEVSEYYYKIAVKNLNVKADKANMSILAGLLDKASILSCIPKELILTILQIKSNLPFPSFEEYRKKYVRITNKFINQNDLMTKYGVGIHYGMQCKFVALEIKASLILNENEIGEVANIAYRYVCQQYRLILAKDTNLNKDLSGLRSKGIQFKTFAHINDPQPMNFTFN